MKKSRKISALARKRILPIRFLMENKLDFLFGNPFVAIHKVEFTADLHIRNGKGCKTVSASGYGLVGKGDGTVVRNQVADHGKIADRDATLEVVKRKASVRNGVVQ